MRKKLLYFIIPFSSLIFSCDKVDKEKKNEERENAGVSSVSKEPVENLAPDDYIKWVETPENHFLLEKRMNEFSYVAFHKPVDYLALLEHKDLDSIDKTEFYKIRGTYEGMEYFTFKISTTATNDELIRYKLKPGEDYFDRLDYLSFKAQQDFYLISKNDTSACSLFHFERSFGLAPVLTFVLGFELKNAANDDLTFVYEDKVFGNGTLKFLFGKESQMNQPELNIRTNKN